MKELMAMSTGDRLWYFMKDSVPAQGKDVEVVIMNIRNDMGTQAVMIPVAIEMFETIGIYPDKAEVMYPEMKKYLGIIQDLHERYYDANFNPFWHAQHIMPPGDKLTMKLVNQVARGEKRGWISLDAHPYSVALRLCYGDLSHQHDFVGPLYFYAT